MIDDPDNPTHRDAHLLFWIVKGHFNTTEDTILSSAKSYFNRVWRMGCDGAPISDYEEGFEEAYQKVLDKKNKQ